MRVIFKRQGEERSDYEIDLDVIPRVGDLVYVPTVVKIREVAQVTWLFPATGAPQVLVVIKNPEKT